MVAHGRALKAHGCALVPVSSDFRSLRPHGCATLAHGCVPEPVRVNSTDSEPHGCVTSEHSRYRWSACKADRPCRTLLPITSSTELGFEQFKKLRIANSEGYNFCEDTNIKFIYMNWPKLKWIVMSKTRLKLKSTLKTFHKPIKHRQFIHQYIIHIHS